jgi:type I restriction enzyme S subunit
MSNKTKTASMNEAARSTMLPTLRFTEFRGEALRRVQLGDVTEEGRRRNGKKHSAASVMGVTKADGIVPMEARLVSADIERYKLVERDWFAYNPMRLNIGSIARWKGDSEIVVSPDYVVFKCIAGNELGMLPDYLDHFRQGKAWEDFVTEGGDGGVRVRIYYKDIARIQLELPSLPEQQRIAECLSSVDELMAAQARKVDALRTHKKGLLQQLFPLEGESQPRLRFPEFHNAGEWEEGELGPKATKVGSGITPTGGDKNYTQSGRPFVRSQNVGWGILLLDDIAYIDEETHTSFKSTEIQVRDVLLNITGASIGRSAVADKIIAGGNVNQHVCIIRTKPDELNPFFLNHYLISQRGQKQIDSFQAGGNRQGLNFAQIRSFAIPLPPSPEEQQRIASCLSSLDAQITLETQKLEALKTHKKGLMQQLFPSPEATEA